jgi:ubiquinone/menaquinone biosynthesis C-methylase UbiE
MQRLGQEWTDQQQALWDGFSKDFQAHFERWTMPAAESLAQALNLAGGLSILEVGCGGGGAGASLRQQMPPGVAWSAVDLSPAMVKLAQAALGAGATVIQGSAEALPFGDAEFDRVFSNLCLMLVADPVQALAEARRVLAPSGRAGWTVWGRAAHSPMMTLVGQACEALSIEVQATERQNFHLGSPGDLVAQVLDAGFSDAQAAYFPMTIHVANGKEFAQEMLYTGPRRRDWMASLGDAIEAALVAEVTRRADGLIAVGQPLCLDVLQVVARA